MKEDASLEQWKELYQITIKIQNLQPWDFLWETNIITIMLPNYAEPYFCNITGRETNNFAVNTFLGYEGFYSYFDMIHREETNIPLDYVMFEQVSLSCYFVDKEEVPHKQRKILKSLSLKFRKKENWIYFESHKKGYLPYILDKEEVILLTQCYKQLYLALLAYQENPSFVCFEKDETLLREYNKNQQLWENQGVPLSISERHYPIIYIEEENIKKELEKQPFVDMVIELDLIYTHVYMEEKHGERKANPKLLLSINIQNKKIMKQETFTPEEKETPIILNMLIDMIMEYGRMKKIIVRNPFLESVIKDTCEFCEILVERKKKLDTIDEFQKKFQRFMNRSSLI